MEQKLFTELRPLYMTSKENPNEIRIRIRMLSLTVSCHGHDDIKLR